MQWAQIMPLYFSLGDKVRLHLKTNKKQELEKQEQTEPKISRRYKDLSTHKWNWNQENNTQKINEMESWFFEKMF